MVGSILKIGSFFVIILTLLTACTPGRNRLKAGIQVFAEPNAQVLINHQLVGQTPFLKQDLKPDEYRIEIATDSARWVAHLKLTPGTLAVVNRTLVGKNDEGPSGEILSLEKGKGVAVVSDPDQATVVIDGQVIGRTPLVFKDLVEGSHQLIVSADGFHSRSIMFEIHKNYRTVINIQLAKKMEKLSSGPLNHPAQVVVIAPTPTGWLRVRQLPSLSAPEIGRVLSGESYLLLELGTEWSKIKLNTGQEGWVASRYLQR